MEYLSILADRIQGAPGACWNWFGTLSLNEWFFVLGVGAFMGFFCMRGYGGRDRV